MKHTAYQKMLLIYGPKRSGKSTIQQVIKAMHSPDSVAAVSFTQMDDMQYRGGILRSVVNLSSEVKDYNSNAEDFLKAVVAGDPIGHRDLYSSTIENITPICKLIFFGNDLLRTSDTSGAVVDRLLVVQCPNFREEEDRDVELVHKLLEEMPGILNRVIAAGVKLIARGLFDPPKYVKAARRRVENLQDSVGAWTREAIAQEGSEEYVESPKVVPTRILYTMYREWCEVVGRKPTQEEVFKDRMARLGYKNKQWARGGKRGYGRAVTLLNNSTVREDY